MAQIHPYITFDGTCEEAFNFYKSVLGGEFPYIGRFGDMPQQEGMPALPNDAKDRIMHVSLPLSQDTVLMGSDTMPGMQDYKAGNNIALSLNAQSREEAQRLFQGLSEGGTVTMPLEDTFWGAYFGMWTDKFGIHWMVNYDDPAQTPH